MFVVQIFANDLLGVYAEHAVYHPAGDERLCEQFLLEMQSVALNLLACHGDSRGELSEQSVDARCRDGPDTEEAQHVVYAVGIKEFRHVLESAYPPLASVVNHPLPVVCRESPVLSVD